MRYTYIASDNTAANGVQLGDASSTDRDIIVYGAIFGLPATSKNFYVYDNNAAVNGSTANIAIRLTTPASLVTGQLPYVLSFANAIGTPANSGGQNNGTRLATRGTVITDASQVTVLWDYAD